MIGFDDGSETERSLDGDFVATINSDLTGTIDLSRAQALAENRNIGFRCDEKGGPFDIGADLAQAMLDAPTNPNG